MIEQQGDNNNEDDHDHDHDDADDDADDDDDDEEDDNDALQVGIHQPTCETSVRFIKSNLIKLTLEFK